MRIMQKKSINKLNCKQDRDVQHQPTNITNLIGETAKRVKLLKLHVHA